MYYTTTGVANVAVGVSALQNNTTASNNTAVGFQALIANITASSNTAFGHQAGYSNTTGSGVTYVGYRAGFSSTGSNNTYMGFESSQSATSAVSNSSFGYRALYSASTGSSNVALGTETLRSNTTASYNTAVGYHAGYSAAAGGASVFVGGDSGKLTTGGNNTFVGKDAGYWVTTGTKNTILGAYSGNQGGLDIRTLSNNIVLSDGDGEPRVFVNNIGNMGVATTSPRNDIRYTSGTADTSKRWGFGGPAGSSGSALFYIINESNVGQYMSHGGQAWVAHSDERIKENIVDVGTVLPSLMGMRCVKYNLISNPDDVKIGFIAQDWETSFPEVIDENPHLVLESDGTVGTEDDSDSNTPVKAMAYTETIPLLLKAIQEQQATITALEARIATLEG